MLEYNNFIAIGKIAKTIGIKGNLKIIPLTDFPDRFYEIKKLHLYDEVKKSFFVNPNYGGYDFLITECKVFDKYVNLKFDNYNSIERSRELINLILMIDEEHRVKLEDGSYYFYELIDAEVFDRNEYIGKVLSVLNYGSGDLFNIKHKEKEVLIPFNEEFVKKIDMINKRIDVELIDGFLD